MIKKDFDKEVQKAIKKGYEIEFVSLIKKERMPVIFNGQQLYEITNLKIMAINGEIKKIENKKPHYKKLENKGE